MGEDEDPSMESALKCRARPPPAMAMAAAAAMDDVVDQFGGFLGEEFSVDDLFDFAAANGEEETEEEEERGHEAENSDENSSGVSAAPCSSEIVFPDVDAAELEWVSRIMDDESFSVDEYFPAGACVPKIAGTWPAGNLQAGDSSGTSPPTAEEAQLVPAKPWRIKRARRTATIVISGHPSPAPQHSLSSSSASPSSSCSSPSAGSSCLIYDFPQYIAELLLAEEEKPKARKRGRKPKRKFGCIAGRVFAGGDRRCSHCGCQKTPQWRAGPEGQKTLCNACGVRFKSGRLLPEYRPAGSPTFLNHVHSNSHRKVLEMRRKKEKAPPELLAAAAASPAPVVSF